ncbi:hypothetical protein GCM10022286_00740 [Gryllotalpicola daejeonensis]|uniref:Sigma-70 family RNA polymerase sigma factor n=1 Tax=Gryllotalpicola daejeonensis TaxID=993087 RepID=A0ABP7ZCZ9_9MICO
MSDLSLSEQYEDGAPVTEVAVLSVEQELERAELFAELWSLVDGLPSKPRQALLMTADGATISTVANRTHSTVEQAAEWLDQAASALRVALLQRTAVLAWL